jgi:hypothetical protein
MRTLLIIFACALGLGGCDAGGGPGAACQYGGKSYRSGETFPSLDRCNTCSCLGNGQVACTEKACLDQDLGPDGGGGGDAGGGDAGDSTVMCTGATPIKFPTFDKSCRVAGDCFIALHQINCCGTLKALGYNKAEQARFDAAEKICRQQYPGCGCAAMPTTAEDGRTSMREGDIGVECAATGCRTFIR